MGKKGKFHSPKTSPVESGITNYDITYICIAKMWLWLLKILIFNIFSHREN